MRKEASCEKKLTVANCALHGLAHENCYVVPSVRCKLHYFFTDELVDKILNT